MSRIFVSSRGGLAALVAIALALTPLPSAGQGPTGTLQGVIRDSLSARPVVDARVAVRGTAFVAITDSNGHYFINGLPAGNYDVRMTAEGHLGIELRGVRIRSGHTVTQDVTLAIEPRLTRHSTPTVHVQVWTDSTGRIVTANRLPAGQEHLGHRLNHGTYTDGVPVSGHGIVQGTIRDERHQPIAAARVSIVGTDLVATTDSLGRYRFAAVPAGSFDLRAASLGHVAKVLRGVRVMSRQIVTQDLRLADLEVKVEDPLFRRLD